MANTTADKLALLEATKAAMKSAINGSGSTVGDVFSAYPAAITSGKSAIAQAITDKGVATAATDSFAQMAANIGQIQTGTDTSDATATAGDILSGKTAYGAAGKLTGTIPSQNATTITPGTSAKTAIPAGTYAAGKATVAGDANLIAGNIKEGVSIFGVAGSFAGESVGSVVGNIQFMDGGAMWYINQNGVFSEMQSSGQINVQKNTIVYVETTSPRTGVSITPNSLQIGNLPQTTWGVFQASENFTVVVI